MKRILFFLLLPLITCTVWASQKNDAPDESPYIKVYIQKVFNKLTEDCSLNGLPLPADESVKLLRPILIPFVSIRNYIKHYTAQNAERKAFTPDAALSIQTPDGNFRLWASESGIMYAPDPATMRNSLDNWNEETLLAIKREEHNGKKLLLATLVVKTMQNKINLALETVG